MDKWDVFRELPIPKVPTPFRILVKAVKVSNIIAKHEVAAGRIRHADLASPEILRYERSALGTSRII